MNFCVIDDPLGWCVKLALWKDGYATGLNPPLPRWLVGKLSPLLWYEFTSESQP